jgi:aldehyde dehydrogenase (NAD+)
LDKNSLNHIVEVLNHLNRLIKSHEPQIAVCLKNELGRHSVESYISEIIVIKEEIKFALSNIKKWHTPQKVITPFQLQPAQSYIHYEPYGTVLIVAPWNFPFHLSLVPAIGALAAGNKVIIKTSPRAPESSRLIFEIINNKLNSDLLKVVEGGSETVAELIAKDTDFIFFTGSAKHGKEVYKLAAGKMLPVVMELGGQNPLIFHNDGFLKAVDRIVWGKLLNAGQTCLAPNHVFIHHSVKDDFLKEFKKQVGVFFGNNVLDNDDYPRLIDSDKFFEIDEIISKNKDRIVCGGKSDEIKLKIEPTLLDFNIDEINRLGVIENEIFGPVLPMITYQNIDDVMKIISASQSPLAIYAYTSDSKLIDNLTQKTKSGSVCINDCLVHGANPYFPFGGVRQSGIGKYHGKHSFLTFSNAKSVLTRSKRFSLIPRFPPYSKRIFEIFKFI